MKKRRVLWAIAFGSMLAVTGCGDSDGSGGGGSSGSGGGSGGDVCATLCEACSGESAAQCSNLCEGFTIVPGSDDCTAELSALAGCFEANDCDGDACEAELDAWGNCIIGQF